MAWLFSKALIDRCANSPSLPEQAVESSEAACLAGELYVPSSATSTPLPCSWQGKTTDALSRFRSGMTFALSTADRGAGVLKSCLEDFPVRTFQPQEREQELTASDPGCGPKWRESLAKYDPGSRSWKTRQCLLHGGLAEFSETWPKWGMTRDGVAYRLQTPDCLTSEAAYGLWPTPTKFDAILLSMMPANGDGVRLDRHGKPRKVLRDGRTASLGLSRLALQMTGKVLTPEGFEAVMRWPSQWTGLRPLAMGKFLSWLRSHGDFCQCDIDEDENDWQFDPIADEWVGRDGSP